MCKITFKNNGCSVIRTACARLRQDLTDDQLAGDANDTNARVKVNSIK